MQNATKTETENELLEHCQHIAKQIETGDYDFEPGCDGDTPNAMDYLKDALDIRYVVDKDCKYLAARVCVAWGGPGIWINTDNQTIEGFWWNDSAVVHYRRDELGLDEALEAIFDC